MENWNGYYTIDDQNDTLKACYTIDDPYDTWNGYYTIDDPNDTFKACYTIDDPYDTWNGYYTIDDPDDRLKPWDNPIVKEAIDTAKEENDETLKIIAKAKAEIMEWMDIPTNRRRAT